MEQLYYTLTEATIRLKMDAILLGERGLLAMAYRHREMSNTEKTEFVIEYIKPGWEAVDFSYVTAAQFGKIVNAARTQDRAILRDLFNTLEELSDSDEIIKRRNTGVHLLTEKLLFSGVKMSHQYAGLDDMFVTAEAMRAYVINVEPASDDPAPLTTAPANEAATPAPVVTETVSGSLEPDKTKPLPLTTNEIANCFNGFREWDVKRWKRELGSPDKWLKDCQNRKGTRGRGGYESTWWPVKIALALANKDQKFARFLLPRFQKFEKLKPWLEELENNIPVNFEMS